MYIKLIALCFGLLSFTTFSSSPMIQSPVHPEATMEGMINWMTWEEAVAASKENPKKIMVDIYTDWCGWCKRMDTNTFQTAAIAEYVNEHYYAVKFDAEQKGDIEFNGKTYRFINNDRRGYHELAAELTKGRLGYPTTVFLDEQLSVIQSIAGYKSPEDFEAIITYFGGDFHRKMPWDKYRQSFSAEPTGN
ncbi:MAG: DUF255 domain-containing protein [Saprospiraceae bacterium]|nr:DUF255 domain-containing protein [Saprospiraceae bacterium]